MSDLIGIVLLVALLVFIILDSRRLHSKKSEPLSRDKMEKGFVPGRGSAHGGLLVFAAVLIFMGAKEWEHPAFPPYQGRSAWFFLAIYQLFGPRGAPIIEWLLAGILVVGVVGDRERMKRNAI